MLLYRNYEVIGGKILIDYFLWKNCEAELDNAEKVRLGLVSFYTLIVKMSDRNSSTILKITIKIGFNDYKEDATKIKWKKMENDLIEQLKTREISKNNTEYLNAIILKISQFIKTVKKIKKNEQKITEWKEILRFERISYFYFQDVDCGVYCDPLTRNFFENFLSKITSKYMDGKINTKQYINIINIVIKSKEKSISSIS